MVNIAVFASGNGSNAVNLVNTFNGGSRIRVALCLTDRENAPVIEKMAALGVESEFFPRSVWKEDPQTIIDILHRHDIRLIVLAGFLCYVHPDIVRAYEGKILNIHPSLLPAYGGKGMHGARIHEAVIAAGETKSGATVHIVTENIDEGPVVLQKEVAVLPDDTAETLEAKVHAVEYQILPEAVMKTLKGLEPPAVPKSVDDAWAETLGVANNAKADRQPEASPAGYTPQAPASVKMDEERPWLRAANGHTAQFKPEAPMPSTWLVWSVVCTVLCCTLPGIIAILQSARVSSRYYAGDIEGAQRASRNAEIWIIISFVLGVISNTLYIPLTLAGWM